MPQKPDKRQEWFTAREVADLARRHGIEDVPHSATGMTRWIARQAGASSDLSRQRIGPNGRVQTLYHALLFHTLECGALGAVLDQTALRRRLATGKDGTEDLPDRQTLEAAEVAARGEARATILSRIEAYRISNKMSRNAAVAAFVAAVATAAQRKLPPFAAAVAGFDLFLTDIRAARGWSNASNKAEWTLSRRTVYEWMKAEKLGQDQAIPTRALNGARSGAEQLCRSLYKSPSSVVYFALQTVDGDLLAKVLRAQGYTVTPPEG